MQEEILFPSKSGLDATDHPARAGPREYTLGHPRQPVFCLLTEAYLGLCNSTEYLVPEHDIWLQREKVGKVDRSGVTVCMCKHTFKH